MEIHSLINTASLNQQRQLPGLTPPQSPQDGELSSLPQQSQFRQSSTSFAQKTPNFQFKLPPIQSMLDNIAQNESQGAYYPQFQSSALPLSPLSSRSPSVVSVSRQEQSLQPQNAPHPGSEMGSFPAHEYPAPQKPLILISSQRSFSSNHPSSKKKRSNLPKKTTMILLTWLNENLNHPYPSSKQKNELIFQTGLSSQQLSNWFINARRRKISLLREIRNNTTEA
ncbi:unnamed protein product [Kuraishia capsulata CBS 1993]|uniref:Homeobox domain-containing protein n=1 Tax=Kuraishia capsulata CBS 1993 TaxID=1382522 RepID=W6MU14_9ASCO|nr:uncharacterized protein KUCA_T00004797001 [Kuraishia capsulata CBS 1993]CDK28812.1 unnamed protein product [Kuraishia capsulata CBS 1993]